MPVATRTFRVFVSSTFEDLKDERDALQRVVFPRLRKLCEEKGARFQAIDLRWGVRAEASLDQKTMEICLREIERCQQTGIKPNFIVLLGDRYGWCPVPAMVDKDEFNTVLSHVADRGDGSLVRRWYDLDYNAVPPQYVLKPRKEEYRDWSEWEPIERRIRDALRSGASNAGLATAGMVKYEASATHQEILRGLGESWEDRKHVYAFFRDHQDPVNPDLARLKQHLKEALPASNIFSFPRAGIQQLCDVVEASLKAAIEATVERFEPLSEKEFHDRIA